MRKYSSHFPFAPLFLLLLLIIIACTSPLLAFDAFENKEVIEPLVAFYKRLNEKQTEEFIKITSNPKATGGKFHKELKEFAKKNDMMDAYKNLKNSYNNWKVQMLKMAPDNLAGSALKAFNKIKDFLEEKSPNATLGDQCRRLDQILAETEPMVRNFLPNEPGDFLCLNAAQKKKMVQRIMEDFGGAQIPTGK